MRLHLCRPSIKSPPLVQPRKTRYTTARRCIRNRTPYGPRVAYTRHVGLFGLTHFGIECVPYQRVQFHLYVLEEDGDGSSSVRTMRATRLWDFCELMWWETV